MKKVLSMLLALVMLFSLSAMAFADSVVDTEAELQAAFTAGGDVVLGGNVTVMNGLTVPAGVEVNLDLAGYTISGVDTSALYQLIHVKYGAALNISDSGTTGLITYDAGTENKTGAAIFVEGELTLYSGTIEITGDWFIGFAVDAHPNAWGATYTEPTVFTMKGGKIKASDSGVRVANYSASGAADSAVFIMEGGEIESAYDGVFVQHVTACDLSVDISDGTITSENTHAIRIYGSAVNDVEISISGGELNGHLTNLENTGNGETQISGGSFSEAPPAELVEEGKLIFVDDTPMVKESGATSLGPATVPATGITLDRTALSLIEGESADLTATVEPSYSTDEITWTSSDESVAAVDNNGKVTAMSKGTAAVTATAGSVSASCTVTVGCDHDIVKACEADYHVDYCTKCETEMGEREPHEMGEWVVVEEPTTMKTGLQVRECVVGCGYEEEDRIARIEDDDIGELVIPESQKPAAEDKDNGKSNPATGSTDFVNVAVALGVVSLAAAAAVIKK